MAKKKSQRLIAAAMKGDEEGLVAMIGAGFDVDVKNKAGMTAAMWASANGQKSCLAHLIATSCDVNAKNEDGWTSAMWAAVNGQEECLARLIAAGCNIDAKNNEGKTAEQLARFGSECQEMLEAQSARQAIVKSICAGQADGAKKSARI